MHPLAVTLAVVLGCVLLLVGYDVYLHATGGYRATISHLLLEASRRQPLIPLFIGLALGILLGHLYWPQQP
jgi:hypothetical protein